MSLFSDDFKLEMSDKVIDYDTSHIYTGHIYGKCRNGGFCFELAIALCLDIHAMQRPFSQ